MRRARKFLRVLVVILVAVGASCAEPIVSLKPTGYVNDFASVLSASTKTQLDEMCGQVDEKAKAQIAVVTIRSTDGEEIFNYSVDLYQKWGIGKKGTDRGVLVLLAVQDRRYWTTVGYGLEGILPDGKVGGFGREAVPLLRQGDYNGAVALLTSRIVDVIAKDAGVTITTSQPRQVEPSDGGGNSISLGGLLVLGVIVLIVLFTPLRKLLFYGLLFGGGGPRYRGGGWGGGGFGGGGYGGGGFGGFGGGSTGGGGAGGSW